MTTRPADLPVARFGPFELDLATGELRKKGMKVPLQEQSFEVLSLLVQRAGELVTREELRDRLSAGAGAAAAGSVDDDRVNKAVVKIRRALGDLAQSPHFVETLARRGYRFVAAVERGGAAAPAAPILHAERSDAP